jgi:hypothetical protein
LGDERQAFGILERFAPNAAGMAGALVTMLRQGVAIDPSLRFFGGADEITREL